MSATARWATIAPSHPQLSIATKKRMVELMNTSRAHLDRLLDPDNGGATIERLQRAASIVGR